MLRRTPGRELLDGWETIEQREPTGRRVLVVGGGPAGLEAARTAALLGHTVTLWEARDVLGKDVQSREPLFGAFPPAAVACRRG